jgi:hypothetical protein
VAFARSVLALVALAVAMVAGERDSRADPLNPWTGKVMTDGLELQPFVYVANTAHEIVPITYVGWGISDRLDLWAGIAGDLLLGHANGEPAVSSLPRFVVVRGQTLAFDALENFEAMPRYFFVPDVALALHLTVSPGDSISTAVELHAMHAWSALSLSLNLGERIVYDLASHTVNAHSLFALVAPEHYFSKRFSVFLEVDPELDGVREPGRPVAVTGSTLLVPGVSLALDDKKTSSFALGVQLELPAVPGWVSMGMWFDTTFGGDGGDATPRKTTAHALSWRPWM